MKSGSSRLKGLSIGMLIALVSGALVFGTVVLAFSETTIPLGSPTPQPSLSALIATLPTINVATPSATIILPTMTSVSMVITSSPTFTSITCPIPSGWKPIVIRSGDTLNKLAMQYGISPQALADGNCLTESRLEQGSTLYVPTTQPTEPPQQCGSPAGWITYYVQPGDTLYNIGLRVGLSVYQLMYYNCLSTEIIQVGQLLYLPYPPQPIPSPTGLPAKPPPRPTNTPPPPPTPTVGPISRDPPKPTLSPPNPAGTSAIP